MKTQTFRIALVQQLAPHYRLPVFRKLMESDDFELTLISGHDKLHSIKNIDSALASIPVEKGGLRWQFVKNIWLYREVFLWQSGLYRLLVNNHFDAVVLSGNIYHLSTWLALFRMKLAKRPVFMWTHGVNDDSKGFKWQIRKRFYTLCDGILLYGHHARNIMIRHGMDAERLHVVYNSLDYDRQVKLRRQLAESFENQVKAKLFQDPGLPLLIFIGRLIPEKKLDMLINATAALHSQGLKVNTLIIGDGSIRAELQASVEQLNLKRWFNFFGGCYDDKVIAELMSAADLCVSPGEIGLTAITSLTFGTPTITHDDFNNQGPEFEAIDSGVNGAFFSVGSVESLTDTISSWINKHDGCSREEIRKRCYAVIDSHYTPKNQTRIITKAVLSSLS